MVDQSSKFVKFYLLRLKSTPSIVQKYCGMGQTIIGGTYIEVSVKENGGINVGHDHGRG